MASFVPSFARLPNSWNPDRVPENEIIAELHRHRAAVARECDYDATKLMAYYRRREAERTDESHPLVCFTDAKSESCIVREEPPKR